MQLFNVQINSNKKIIISLQKIFGLGKFSVLHLCKNLGFTSYSKGFSLKQKDLLTIKHFILKNFVIQLDLKRKIKNNIIDLIKIKSYRGFRHRLKLPVRGQRSHTNRKTQRLLGRKYVK